MNDSEFSQETQGAWLSVIDQAIMAAERAELKLSCQGGRSEASSQQRKVSGSYYTPSDVADHFWSLFFRHHRISDLRSLLAFVGSVDLVEPSVGSGMFVFSFLKKAAMLGATPENLAGLRFHVVDINLAALRFFSEQMQSIESVVSVKFIGIITAQNDFLEWVKASTIPNVIFVGNPPFVANPRNARWRNLYADFVEAMLVYVGVKGISLILPLSICFSRDYTEMRTLIRSMEMGISASSYDNIPDCLFKAGKPDSTNTNRANSQRCTILNIGGPDKTVREASPLLKWSVADRLILLSTTPTFQVFTDIDPSGQIPRPATCKIADYMRGAIGAPPLRTFLSRVGQPTFSVGNVARNYIGIRDSGAISIRGASEEDSWLAFQLLSSEIFYDYWRTYGDGFHVTIDLIERFPVTAALAEQCRQNQVVAQRIWADRAVYAKEKLNSGLVVRSYDFRAAFSNQ